MNNNSNNHYQQKNENIKNEILDVYKNILLTKRRKEQVEKIIKDKRTTIYLDKCAKNIIQWNVPVREFIESQFFALNYMPYLPSMMHIASDKALERYEKVKHFFKKKSAQENLEKVRKRYVKNTYNKDTKEYLLSFLTLQNYEEKEKLKHFNTIPGFFNCIENKIYYHPKSKICNSCKFKNHCKKNLKKNLLPLYEVRHKLISVKQYLKKMLKMEQI